MNDRGSSKFVDHVLDMTERLRRSPVHRLVPLPTSRLYVVGEVLKGVLVHRLRTGREVRCVVWVWATVLGVGLQVGELAGLDVEHGDLDAGTVYLPTEVQKGSPPPATLELERDTVRTLRRYLRDRWKDTSALLPTRSSDRITTRSLRRLVEKLALASGIKPEVAGGGVGEPADVTPHTLRHSVAYRIIQVDGGRLEDVQLRLRHANRETTDRIYSHLVPR